MNDMERAKTIFKSISVNKSSRHPTTDDSAHVEAGLFSPAKSKSTPDLEKFALQGPLVTNVVVTHSSAFNSERASGMNKVQQLEFTSKLKAVIVGMCFYYACCFLVRAEKEREVSHLDQYKKRNVGAEHKNILEEAALLYPQYTSLKVTTSRTKKSCTATATTGGICDVVVHMAHLVGLDKHNQAVLLEQSSECEFLSDAAENLWEEILAKAGVVFREYFLSRRKTRH